MRKKGYTFTYRCRKTFLNIPVDIRTGRTQVRMCRYFDMDLKCNLHLGKKFVYVRGQKQEIKNDQNVN